MNFNQKPVKIFFSYYKPHLKYFIADMMCALLIAIIDVSFPIATRTVLNTVIPQGKMRFFFILIALMVVTYGIRYAALWFVNYWGHYFGVMVETDMRHDVFSHLEKQGFGFFDRNLTGSLMSRATTDLFEITELAHHGPEDFLTSVLTLIGSCVLLFRIRWELAVVVFAFLKLLLVAYCT